MARKVRQIRRKGKDVGVVPVPVRTAPDVDTRVALIQALIPVALEKVHLNPSGVTYARFKGAVLFTQLAQFCLNAL